MLVASVSASTLSADPAFTEPRVAHGARLAMKKGRAEDAPDAPEFLATIEQVHTGEHLVLDDETPSQARFDAIVSDRVTGESHPLDEHLLGLLRALAAEHPGARIEIVSGYRSPKLNEMLRKKGHHVASHTSTRSGTRATSGSSRWARTSRSIRASSNARFAPSAGRAASASTPPRTTGSCTPTSARTAAGRTERPRLPWTHGKRRVACA